MAQLPADRTKLAQAQSNMAPSFTASSQKLKDALTEAYDTVDLLNQKADNHASAATLPHADKSVIRAKLADKVVGAGQLDDAAVGQSHHQDNGIPSRAIGDNVIIQRHMSDNSVGSAEIQPGGVQAGNIANGAINSQHINATFLSSAGQLATQAEFDKREINVEKFSNLVTTGDWKAAMQAACDAAAAQGLKVVRLTDGTFTVSDAVTIPLNVSLYGSGRNTVIKGLTAGKQVININGGNSVVSNLTIDGDNKSIFGIYVNDNSINVKIENVEIKNLYGDTSSAHGIRVKDGCSNILIDFCKFKNISGTENGTVGDTVGANRGVMINQVTRTTVSNCLFEDIYGFEDGDGIQVQVMTAVNGIWGESDVTIENCTFLNVTKRAIKFQASGCTAKNNTIKSSQAGAGAFGCPHAGISLYSSDHCTITGNSIDFARSVHGIEMLSSSFTTVTNNDIAVDIAKLYTDARGGNTQMGIGVTGGSNNIIDKNIVGCTSRGIYLFSGTDQISVSGNIIRDMTLYPIYATSSSHLDFVGNKIYGKDNDFLVPYQGIALDNCTGTVSVVGNYFERSFIGIRVSGIAEDVRIHGNSFNDVVEKVRTLDLNAGQDVNITIGDGQINKNVQLTAVPTTGTWRVGDLVINSAPASGVPRGWECVTAGTFTASTAWVASTAYTVGTHVNANSKVYKCTTAGTSGTVAPSHTYGTATDGTVTWAYVGVFATPAFRSFGKLVDQKTGVFTANGDGTNTFFNIPHGLGGSVWAMVQESNAATSTAGIDYVQADATNIVVKMKVAPVAGTGNVIMRWIAER